MHLILIRHGLPVVADLPDGQADPALDPRGHAHAEHLARYLASEPIDAIYVSPMRRALETAAPLAATLGIEPVVEPDVAESDSPSSTYVPVEMLKADGDPRWRAGMTFDEWPDDHEPLATFHERVMRGIEGIIERHPGGTVAVVCHGGVICRYTSTILGHPWEETGFFYPLYTSITRVMASRSGARFIATLNETSHLRGTGLPDGSLWSSDQVV